MTSLPTPEPVQREAVVSQRLERLQQPAHVCVEGGAAPGLDAGKSGLALRNLMRAAVYGDPFAQWDLGVLAMRRLVSEGK